MLLLAILFSCFWCCNCREYVVDFATVDKSWCGSTSSITFYLASNCSLYYDGKQNQVCDPSTVIRTSEQSFTPLARYTISVSFDDIDIGPITHLYMAGGSDEWCFSQFSILIDDNDNEYRNCSFDAMGYMTLETDCSDNDGMYFITIDVSNTSALCNLAHNTNIAPSPTQTTHRTYAAEMVTSDAPGCESDALIRYFFLSSCSLTSHGVEQRYCNESESLTTSNTANTFTPASYGNSTIVQYTDYNDLISGINYIYLQTNSNDAWCLDSIKYLVNDVTNEWRSCDFGTMLGMIVFDTDCIDFNGGFDILSFDLDTLCYDDDPAPTFSSSARRKYALEITTNSDAFGPETFGSVSMQFLSNCMLSGATTCDGQNAITTNAYSFSPAAAGETASVSFYDIDIEHLDYLYLSLEESNTNAWVISNFSILINDTLNLWRDCSFDWTQFWALDNDCSRSGATPFVTIDVSDTSPICHTRGTSSSSSASSTTANITISDVSDGSNRSYAAFVTTADSDECATIDPVQIRFVQNCSFYDDSNYLLQTCNFDNPHVSTPLYAFTPGGRNEEISFQFEDISIGPVNFAYLEMSQTDAWCLTTASFLINADTDDWVVCDFSDLLGYLELDPTCSGGTGTSSITIDLLSDDTICYYDRSLRTRTYGFEATTFERLDSDTDDTARVQFISNCDLSAGTSTTCDEAQDAVSTLSYEFVPGGLGATASLTFLDRDVGEIDYLYLSFGGQTDGWLISKISILVDAEQNAWRDCTFEWKQFWTFDNDCDFAGGVPYVTLDVSNTSSICKVRGINSSSANLTFPSGSASRRYAAKVTTASGSGCDTIDAIDWQIINSCTFSDNNLAQHYCNTGETIVGTSQQSFTPGALGSSVFTSFIETNIGAPNYVYLDISGDDAWCLSEISILINDETDQWVTCDFSQMLGFFIISTDCADMNGFDSLTLDLLSEESPCFSDASVSWPTISPSNLPSFVPSHVPSILPTSPSIVPSREPSELPSFEPSVMPSIVPSAIPSANPSLIPTLNPSETPSIQPSTMPSVDPTKIPTFQPSETPSNPPTAIPTRRDSSSAADVEPASMAAIVGGVCAGVAVCALCVGFFVYRTRGGRKDTIVADADDAAAASQQHLELAEGGKKLKIEIDNGETGPVTSVKLNTVPSVSRDVGNGPYATGDMTPGGESAVDSDDEEDVLEQGLHATDVTDMPDLPDDDPIDGIDGDLALSMGNTATGAEAIGDMDAIGGTAGGPVKEANGGKGTGGTANEGLVSEDSLSEGIYDMVDEGEDETTRKSTVSTSGRKKRRSTKGSMTQK